jgi:hypothetical protein
MFVLNAEIQIGDKVFRRVNQVEISSTADRLEDTATIKLPTTARLEREGEYISEVETAKTFSVGDAVTIKLGYNGALRTEFQGYVRAIHPNIPLEIECEDAIYLLKRKTVAKSWRTATLKQILQEILSGTTISLAGDPPTITFQRFLSPEYFRGQGAAEAQGGVWLDHLS